MTSGLIVLSLATILVTAIAVAGPLRERDWAQVALIGVLMIGGYAMAYQLVLGREITSPLRLIERLTHAIIEAFR